MFLVPSGSAGKEYVKETTRLINCFVDDSALKDISMKAVMIMPALLLQKPSKTSKAKQHAIALQRRLALWKRGDINGLIREGETIQEQLRKSKKSTSIKEISKDFIAKMSKGNVNGAMKLLTNNMENGILPLDSDTIKLLRQKHPEARNADEDILLPDIPEKIHPIRYEDLTPELIRESSMRTKGGAGPSGLDGDGWKRIMTSNSFATEATDLCRAIAELAKQLCTTSHNTISLEPLMACRLIPLDKFPGLRPIGIGEVLRRIIGKSVAKVLKNDIKSSIGCLQVCAGQDAGCEAAVHAVRRMFEEDETEAVMLVDAANAFNNVNRKVFLHNVKVICPSLATYVENCYQISSRLFVLGGIELKSVEGTTQGDPIAMFVYAIATIPMILKAVWHMKESNENAKTAAYADDVFGAGSIRGLRKMWDYIKSEGPKYGYFQQESKTWLIVKPNLLPEAKQIFGDTEVKITTDGKKHLGAVIGSVERRKEFMNAKVETWVNELMMLSRIAAFAPQEAYTCFTAGYKHKFNYCMRTIPNINGHMKEIDDIITNHFIPAITGGIMPSEQERKLFALPPSMGGLGIPILKEQAAIEFKNSFNVTKALQEDIISQNIRNIEVDEKIKETKLTIKKEKVTRNKEILQSIKEHVSPEKRKLLEISIENGASTWLTTLPIKDEGFQLDKQSFWDLLKIRYGYQLSRIPERCPCGSNFDLQHALSCKKGGFVSQRHNTLRNVTAKLMSEVCNDVKVEPPLQQLTGESFSEKTSNRSNEARLDISSRGFWVTGLGISGLGFRL